MAAMLTGQHGKEKALLADLGVQSVSAQSDRFIKKNMIWNFQKCPAVLCYILIDKQMLERVFCLNVGTWHLNFQVPDALLQVT